MSKLTDWVLDREEKLRPKFVTLEPFAELLPGWHEVHVQMIVDGRECFGRGTAQTEDLAITKACAEALERAVFFNRLFNKAKRSQMFTNSGIAVHTGMAQARSNARLELIERDLFLCHYLTGTPWRDVTLQKGHTLFSQLRRKLARRGLELRLGSLSEGPMFSYVCCAFGDKHRPAFGVILGLGTAHSRQKASAHAALECLSMLLPRISGAPFRPLTLRGFRRLADPGVEDHLRHAFHIDYASFFRGRFVNRIVNRITQRTKPILSRGYQFERLPMPHSLKTCPLVAVRCVHPALQPLYFGTNSDKYLNLPRLRQFSREVAGQDRFSLEQRPHPLG